mmetsp:Transcript_22600/g.33048  ORF Transcript_22600/g.33048 Transcript_22600/m.33048 type:complete len:125 (-) Transcript_22600:40-414(-)
MEMLSGPLLASNTISSNGTSHSHHHTDSVNALEFGIGLTLIILGIVATAVIIAMFRNSTVADSRSLHAKCLLATAESDHENSPVEVDVQRRDMRTSCTSVRTTHRDRSNTKFYRLYNDDDIYCV